MFYSRSTRGFYKREIHGDKMPGDCVEITDEVYDELLDGQFYGKIIIPDANGYPILAEPTNSNKIIGE
jgi:hypothetical protein